MRIGILLYEGVTALDAVGPFEVLARVPGAEIVWVGQRPGLVNATHGLGLRVDTGYAECPDLDVVLAPGGPGQPAAAEDPEAMRFLRQQAATARWLTSVCTGSLLLGAAGLLRGYRATTHWRYMDCLPQLGAIPLRKRVVADRNRVTAAGVSAGIDLGLFLAARFAGERTARSIQLYLEYDPEPPWRTGHPEHADPELVEALQEETAESHRRRLDQCRRLGAALKSVHE